MVKLIRSYEELEDFIREHWDKGGTLEDIPELLMFRSDFIKIASLAYDTCEEVRYNTFLGSVRIKIIEHTKISKALYG